MSFKADLHRWARRPGPLDAAFAPHLSRTYRLPQREALLLAALLAHANRESVISGGVYRSAAGLVLRELNTDLDFNFWELRSDMAGVRWDRRNHNRYVPLLSGAEDTTLRAQISAVLSGSPRPQRWPWTRHPQLGALQALRRHWGLNATPS